MTFWRPEGSTYKYCNWYILTLKLQCWGPSIYFRLPHPTLMCELSCLRICLWHRYCQKKVEIILANTDRILKAGNINSRIAFKRAWGTSKSNFQNVLNCNISLNYTWLQNLFLSRFSYSWPQNAKYMLDITVYFTCRTYRDAKSVESQRIRLQVGKGLYHDNSIIPVEHV